MAELRGRDERGSVTVLIVGLAVVLLMMAAVVTDASAAYLQRQGLDTLADGAALTGADAGASGDEAYAGGLDRPGRGAQLPPPGRRLHALPRSDRRGLGRLDDAAGDRRGARTCASPAPRARITRAGEHRRHQRGDRGSRRLNEQRRLVVGVAGEDTREQSRTEEAIS